MHRFRTSRFRIYSNYLGSRELVIMNKKSENDNSKILQNDIDENELAQNETSKDKIEPKNIQKDIILPKPFADNTQNSEKERLKTQLLRTIADFDNFRKRIQREQYINERNANKKLILELLPFINNFERALNHTREELKNSNGNVREILNGFTMIYSQLMQIMRSFGLEIFHSTGDVFNPKLHEAVGRVSSEEFKAGIIIKEVDKGFKFYNDILKHAKVIVSKGEPTSLKFLSEQEKDAIKNTPASENENQDKETKNDFDKNVEEFYIDVEKTTETEIRLPEEFKKA